MMHQLRTIALCLLMGAMLVTVSTDATTQEQPGKTETKVKKRLRKVRDRVLRNKVGLSDDKADKVVAILESDQAQRAALDKQIRQARRALNQLVKKNSDDQAAYAAALEALESGHAGLHTLRQKQLGELKALLTPKEQARLLAAMQIVKRRLAARQQRKRMRRPR